MEDLIRRAGRNFEAKLDSGSDLRNFLDSWLGRDYFLSLAGKRLDLDDLIDKPGEATLRHFQGPDFDRPLVIVEGLYPPGTLKLTPGLSDRARMRTLKTAPTGRQARAKALFKPIRDASLIG